VPRTIATTVSPGRRVRNRQPEKAGCEEEQKQSHARAEHHVNPVDNRSLLSPKHISSVIKSPGAKGCDDLNGAGSREPKKVEREQNAKNDINRGPHSGA
jgi:hypothetical protein